MDNLEHLIPYIPATIAYAVLMIAAICKVWPGRGATAFLVGTIYMCVISVVMPIFYTFGVPMIMREMDMPDMRYFWLILGVVTQMIWSVGIVLLAIGLFMRRPAGAQQRPVPPLPIDYQTRL